ncbi:MAG: LysR family transcriptional regulator [Proteobacteria bacterium]|nr:LysR family transcriptional regulator [Pseudomonadota bacterium]
MIKRSHLRQFLAVVDTGSFTAAAERIGISQPSLSVGIAELERQVGARLLLRERRRVRLTEAGSQLLSHARAIEREFQAAETGIARPAPGPAPLRLGVVTSFATRLLEAMVAALGGEVPLVLHDGSDAELRRRLADGQLDAGLTVLREGDERQGALPLFEEDYRMVLGSNHRLARQAMLDPADLASEVMIARRSCEILPETSAFFTGRGVRPPFALRSASDDRCLAMVRAGLGITTAPRSHAGAGLVALPLAGFDFRRRVGLVIRAGLAGDPRVGLLHARATAALTPLLDVG